ncbi:hypothetical protein [Paenibacillus sp. GCM10023250]|uniref:hypothetical protein n=1 Tax=Paenibacillus sp. GCM10023250 TaxID=3252648 RepID=UPI00361A3A4B
MTLHTKLMQAKEDWRLVTIQTDEGDRLTGLVEDLTRWTVTLRHADGIRFVPIAGIVHASSLRQLGDG